MPGSVTGTVLCEHRDLHTARSCNPVFKAEGLEGYLPFCPGTKDVAGVKAAADHGKVKLEVKGKLCKTKDGKELLMVESFANVETSRELGVAGPMNGGNAPMQPGSS